MLKLSNPSLPTNDQGFIADTAPVFRLYSDPTSRESGGIIAQLSKDTAFGDSEVAYFDPAIAKGYFHPYAFGDDLGFDLQSFIIDGDQQWRKIQVPSSLTPKTYWMQNGSTGIYSPTSLEGTVTISSTLVERYRNLSASFDVKLTIPSITPVAVRSLGYTYEAGAGDNQWEYADPILTIHTTASSQIAPNQLIEVECAFDVDFPAPLLQILTFKVEEGTVITGIDLLGMSFTEAFNKYEPNAGDFTLSPQGLVNLYVSMDVILPEIATDQVQPVGVTTGTLTYSRPSGS